MNDEKIVNHMINFIGEKERDFQASKLTDDNQVRNDIVKAVLEELDKEIENEN